MNRTSSLLLSFFLIFLLHETSSSRQEALGSPETSARVATYEGLLQAIRETRAASEARIEAAVEQEKVREAWETGMLIQEHILLNKERAEYGKQVLKRLSGDLGTSVTEIQYMLEFARSYPIYPTSGKLSWRHYRDLLAINDPEARRELESFVTAHELPLSELRKEIKKRRLATIETVAELPEIMPGLLNTYQTFRQEGRLKIDLGFDTYLNLPKEYEKKVLEKILFRNKGKIIAKISKTDDQYGRYLVDVFLPSASDYTSIDQELLDTGLFQMRGDV